jgi:hypothetical protein
MAHKKRYKKLSRQLCEQAVVECFKGKWRRNDVLTFIEKYAGIPRDDIKIDDLSGSWKYKNEAVEAIGLAMQYDVCIDLVMMEIPKARYAIGLLKYLKSVAPGGHLIIGGYLDAWLFNFTMSYAIRYLYTLGSTRRGKKIPYVIRCGTFMDDFSIGSGSIKGEQRAVKALDKWMTKNQHLQIKETTGIVKLLPIEEEKRRRNLPRPGQRGVPMLDMAGYRISRTHITIRRRVFKRARRQLIRGYRELKRDGTLRRERAQKIISYNSYIEQSDSFHLQERYHTEELLQVAHRVNGFYGQLEYQKRMEELHDLLERRCRSEAGKGNDGKSSGWRNDRQDGGQYQGIPSGRRKGSEDVPF